MKYFFVVKMCVWVIIGNVYLMDEMKSDHIVNLMSVIIEHQMHQ